MARRRRSRLGGAAQGHEQSAMRHYNEAEHLARKAVGAGDCKSAFGFYQAAALHYGQALAHERSGGGGFAGEARKDNASGMMQSAEILVLRCLVRKR